MNTFRISGFCEALVIVADPAPHLHAWQEVGGWSQQHHGPVDTALLAAWGAKGATAQEWRLAHPEWPNGALRLVQIEGLEGQVQIRADDQCWDHGGIFDFNVRVLDVARMAQALRNLGWHGTSPPVLWDFSAFTVREWLVKGPDNVRLALIERVAPPLRGFEHLRAFSQVFNSSQLVRDMSTARAFYCDVLGFTQTVAVQLPSLPPGVNVFGLPGNVAATTGLDITILHPESGSLGSPEGSIELVQLLGVEGRDLSADARPPNLGMAALRFQTVGIDALDAHLRTHGWPTEFGVRVVSMAPWGRVKLLAVRAPEGAWLEFFEVVAEPPGSS